MSVISDDNKVRSQIEDWAPIYGRWNLEKGRATYSGPDDNQRPFGFCVSAVQFSDGEARATVRNPFGRPSCRLLLGYLSPLDDYYLVGLGGHGAAYTLVHFTLGTGWRSIITIGNEENLVQDREYKIMVRVQGQRMALEIDGIRVFEHTLTRPLPIGQLGLFAWGTNGQVFTDVSVQENPGDAFVVMQFSGFEELYSDVIKPVTESFGLRPYRADEVYGPGSILADIVRGIETAKIVIAEITPANENVFYEVGYAHALGKPTILIADRGKKLPFDLSGYRCLFYQNSIGGKLRIEEGLRKHLQAILHK